MKVPTRAVVYFGVVVAALCCRTAGGQGTIAAQRRIAYESGRGSMAVRAALNGDLYVLNREDKCVWVFDSAGSSRGHISSVGQGPADLLEPADLAVDRGGNAVVGDLGGAIKVFDPSGKLISFFPFKMPWHVGVLSDGRMLVSGYPSTALIEVYDKSGKKVGQIGELITQDDDPFRNSVLNMGLIVVDDSDNIYYVFTTRTTPTVRKYSASGVLLADWVIKAPHFDTFLPQAQATLVKNKEEGQFGGLRVFSAAAFDAKTRTLWLASLDHIFSVDDSGQTVRFLTLRQPDLRLIGPSSGLWVYGNVVVASSMSHGVHQFQLPIAPGNKEE